MTKRAGGLVAKILLVEDDEDLCTVISRWLAFEHHRVEVATDGDTGLELLRSSKFDLSILDWELPGKTGVELCQAIRAKGLSLPILFLTGKSSLDDKVVGFGVGADDYVTKPFQVKELVIRVKALLRRPAGYEDNVLSAGDLVLDIGKHYCARSGREITLTPTEFALLEFFLRNQNQIYSAEALLSSVWLSDSEASPAAIRTCIRKLRRKLGPDDEESIIENVHGVGYRIASPGSLNVMNPPD